MFEIVKSIKIPENIGRSKYPLCEMNVGDSFRIEDWHTAQKVHVSACYHEKYVNKTKGWKFTVRKEADHYRCWRIK